MEYQIPADVRKKARVLVVEDNILNQKLDAFLLSRWGLQYDICDHAMAAISLLRVKTYDVVLMDIRMPAVNGLEATKVIRNDLDLDIPIIGITAYPTENEKQRCLAAGMNSYLSKPVDERELFRLLISYLAVQKLEGVSDEEE